MLGEVGARLRVRVWSDDAISRSGVVALLRAAPPLELVESDEDVLVVAPLDATVDLAVGLAPRPRAWVLVVGDLTEASFLTCVHAGLGGVVRRSEVTSASLHAAVLSAHDGRGPLPADLGAVLLGALARPSPADEQGTALTVLSEREADVLRLVAEGWSTADVASKLSYSERTIKQVVGRIVRRWHARNRTHAVALAVRRGLI